MGDADDEDGGVPEDEPDPDAPPEEGEEGEIEENEDEGSEDEEEERKRRRRIAGLTDNEAQIAALGDAAHRKLDDIEPSEALETQIENQIRQEVVTPMIRRLTSRAKARWPQLTNVDVQGALNEMRMRASVRVKNYARFHTRRTTAKLTRVRLKAIGVKRYIWETMRDDRVRDTHRVKEGKIYSFDNPPADTGNPGDDYNCRCKARPIVTKNIERILQAKHIVEKPIEDELEALLAIAQMKRQRSKPVVAAFQTVVRINAWHKRRMEEIFDAAMKVRLGGRIQNGRIRRTEAGLAKEAARDIDKMRFDILEDMTDVIVGVLPIAAIGAVGALTTQEEKERGDITEEIRIIWRRHPGLNDEEIDRLFELLLRSKILERKAAGEGGDVPVPRN